MKAKWLHLGMLAAAGSLSGCKSDDTSDQVYVPTQDDANTLLLSASLSCADSASCPDGIAMLNSKTDYGSSVRVTSCTAFSVGGDLLVTNSHCIPDGLKYHDADCSDVLQATFANGDHIRCKQVLEASQLSSNSDTVSPDYAVIQLQKAPSVKPFNLSASGLGEEDVTVYSVDPYLSADYAYGTLVARTCYSTFGSMFLPDFKDPSYGFLALTRCSLIHGNSGSPIVASDSTVRGIFHQAATDDFLRSLSDVALTGETLKGLNFATNFACFANIDPKAAADSNSSFAYKTATNCPISVTLDTTVPSVSSDAVSTKLADALTKANDQIQAQGFSDADIDAVFLATPFAIKSKTYYHSTSKATIVPVPKCFKPSAGWKDIASLSYDSKLKSSANFMKQLPVLNIEAGLNKDFKMDITATPGTQDFTIIFDADKASDDKGALASVYSSTPYYHSIASSTLPVCDK